MPASGPRLSERLTRVPYADVAIVIAFLVFSACVSAFDRGGVATDSDAWDIIAIAQSRDDPGLFVGDGLLGDPENVSIYRNAYVTLVRAMARFTDDYSRAIQALQGPFLFLHLFGFYLLGRAIYGSRYWGLLLAVISATYVDVFGGEYYGTIWQVALPRDLFLALLPFLYWLAWIWRDKPRLWPVLMLAAGFSVYVHPASGPQVGFGVWLALLAMRPASKPWKSTAGQMLLLGVVFVAGATPYLIGIRHQAAGAGDPALFRSILAASYRPLYWSPSAFVQDLWQHVVKGGYLFLAAGVVGLAAQIACFRTKARETAYVGLWFAGIVIVVFLSEVQVALSSRLDFAPVEVNFLRAVRYLPAWCLISALWPLAAAHARVSQAGRRSHEAAVVLAGLLLAVSWLWMFPPRHAERWLACWSRGKLVCPADARESRSIAAFANNVAQSVPPGAAVLSTTGTMTRLVRAYSLRPVVFGQSDGAFVYFSDPRNARTWYQTHLDLKSVQGMDYRAALVALAGKARELGARYLLSDIADGPTPAPPPELGLRRLWRSGRIELFQVGA